MIDSTSKTMQTIESASLNTGMVMSNFFKELGLIKNQDIRSFVKKILIEDIPAYFWTVPASTSGKYHSQDECVDGGLIRHVKRVVALAHQITVGLGWFGHNGATLKDDKSYDYDVIIAACILHDTFKAGFSGRERIGKDGKIGTDALHPYYVRSAVKSKKMGEVYYYKLPFFEDIMTAIEGHYGYWSEIPSTCNLENAQSHEFIVYMADYIASRSLDSWYKI